ncbi:MAG TPA: NADPH-dependent FMN reductase [Bacteriovoracaceae bacterium]|nr:NADPH-dependent FMN reductase [Bacteriovoracaceae bacterium]
MKILTLCGSIRENSTNHSLLIAIQSFFPLSTKWTNFEIKHLPFFDPHLQFSSDLTSAVIDLRLLAKESEYIIISTPEYAHGIPGILKNALEWLICEETMKKKVIVIIGSPSGGEFVKEYLAETLRTMDIVTTQNMTLVIRAARNQVTSLGEINDLELKLTLQKFVDDILAGKH